MQQCIPPTVLLKSPEEKIGMAQMTQEMLL